MNPEQRKQCPCSALFSWCL